ncbi:methionine ABC transporter ATP-binding protein [Cellulosilyticum sp. WCF-2]|uniref:methionine ABC transporter ATP-binding protein n=1 Tax=Cellulosilyticum sp. WCF-2 TaxID=2497860 RepID=UPI000F8EC1D1|nr:ATP-binding cassette domain-containing protein [Cellulosilyticum sp. WCF-2]QEH67821.1 ATP-binding cassette domain-containing protein [Cellulosilyticum sp. WCF-2]
MIKLSHIHKTFHTKGTKVEALKDINLEIEQGDIFGVIGYSGAGKSTLIRIINLLERPDEGEVEVDGAILTQMNKKELSRVRSNIGMIFQGFNLMNSINVYDNIAAPLKNLKWNKKEIEEKVNNLLELVDLTDKKYAYPNQLSGGQKQRVAIARALSSDPKILLCDEATSALDPTTTKSILQLLKEIRYKLNITIVIITHQMEVVKSICNRIAIMEKGEVIESGDIVEVFTSPQSQVAKDFVAHSSGTIINEEDLTQFTGMVCKFNFYGEVAHEPILSKLERDFDIQVNILFGNIEHLYTGIVGSLIVELRGDDWQIQKALDYYRTLNTKVEVIKHATAINT